ncbi:hypothetical protein O181_052912 [Austropuccinia psidii MF-1]|uniref:Uncharacterized protein n=1 Tax=Austropuccinia psidii MF-1 TaxID=1389203 RepID=A0A9Q3E8N7_9BASI|nr:hypothetical protein [Austropuccinia psidii MF-1]
MFIRPKLSRFNLIIRFSLFILTNLRPVENSLEKRSGLTLPSDHSASSTGFQGGKQQLKDPCGYIELTPQTWKDLGIDEYLAHYPNGNKLTLQVSRPDCFRFKEAF